MTVEHLLTWASEDDTQAWAHSLAQQPALANATIELHGDLGAGKTTLVRHLLRALGVQGRIKSPTYALVEPHQAPPGPLWPQGLRISHFDLYRFNDARELEEAGLRELLSEEGLKLIEWPDKAGPNRPQSDLLLTMTPQIDDSRRVQVQAATAVGSALLQGCLNPAQ
jgi:tRNA threonylcarbamoyladenosine biosynthesis protein TsaE